MHEILSLFIVGIALSMDTFSLALSIGTFIEKKKALKLSVIVGIFHFFMPILGLLIGSRLIQVLELQCDIVLGIILLYISVQMLIDLIKKEKEDYNLSFIGMLFFAFGVSIDSFSVGLGLEALTQNVVLATSIFAICSSMFTFLGIILGSFAKKKIGIFANIIGFLILFIMGIVHII